MHRGQVYPSIRVTFSMLLRVRRNFCRIEYSFVVAQEEARRTSRRASPADADDKILLNVLTINYFVFRFSVAEEEFLMVEKRNTKTNLVIIFCMHFI